MYPRHSNKRLSLLGYSNNCNFIKSSKNILNQLKEKIIHEESKINKKLENQLPNLNVIVCDDSTSVRESLKNMLQKITLNKYELRFFQAINGLDCLSLIYTKKEINFDLLLIDETMPYLNGSNLIKLLILLRKEKFQLKMKIVSISGNNDESFMKYLKTEGCDDVLSKEIKISDLENLINKLFIF